MVFKVKTIKTSTESLGQEGGLAPALSFLNPKMTNEKAEMIYGKFRLFPLVHYFVLPIRCASGSDQRFPCVSVAFGVSA
jgi:hypothetical protein